MTELTSGLVLMQGELEPFFLPGAIPVLVNKFVTVGQAGDRRKRLARSK